MNKQEVEMAIKQLKNDIDTVICVYKDTMLGKSKEHFIKCYETAISVLTQQLTDTWIPITEKLPDRLGEVMACNKDGLITIGYIRKREGYYTCEHLPFVTEDIIAWQPLPPAWKGENDG